MTKQGNFTQRTPQAKKQSDQASRQISKQASRSANAPYDLVFTVDGPPPETNRHKPQARKAWAVDEKSTACLDKGLPSESPPPGSVLRTVRRKRRRRVSSSSKDSSDNEDTETGHWKSKNKYREDEDMSRPWRRQKVDAFTRRISDFSEDKKRRMPANVKTYDGTGDPDDHLKIFESAATIENWPQPVWCHMFNSTLVGNARNWFSKLPRRSIDGFEELRRAFRLNFTQRKKCAKNPVELARVKQRQGESTSAYSLKKPPPRTTEKLLQTTGSQEQSRRQSNDQSSSRNNSYRGQRGGRGNDKYTPLTMTPKEILATEGSNFPKPPPMRTPEEQRVGNGYCEYHRQKGHTTNECVQLRQLIDKLVKEGRLDHLVKNIKEGKDKQRSGGKKDAPRDKADTIYMVQSWQRKTKQKPLTIEINAAGHDIHRMYIDGGASADILYEHCFQRLRPEVKSQLNPATTSLTGFTGEKIWPMGQLRLPVMVGNKEHSTTAWMNFMVIRSPSPYNGIIGRPGISAIRAVPSTAHGMLKFPVNGGIVTIYNTAALPKECNTVTCDGTQTHRQHATKVTNLKVAIHPDYPEQEVSIGGSLSDTGRAAVCALLQRNLDIFAWEPKHMTGVPRSITEHKLNIRQGYSPVRQKKRGQALERAKAILEEVHKLVEAGIMQEVYYHDWLSNPVMVKKSDDSWRMCVDFTDLNKACPQDCYPLPEIDCKVESLCGYPFKCFLDAYKGYHQIQIAKDDEEKTAFHTSQGVYCYTKMPFGLKNVGATYQRLVDTAFEGQVGRNLEVYVDNLVIKSHTEDEYLIEPDGIKPCPKKTKAVIQLPSPRTMKEVQSLNGKLAGLNRFLSKSADKSLPLFKTLKKCTKKGDFRWTTEAEEAFTQLKQHIAALPTLVAPRPGEELIMYLSATHGAISAVLLTDRDSVQTPVYFVSKALKETEINYSAMEKLILALVFAAKRLRRYFQAHPIVVITDQPIKQVISKPDASGRLQKWSVLLGEHNISYRPRTAVKGQILADFLIEKPETDAVLPQSEVKLQEPWILFTDGSSCVDGSGAGLILTNPEGMGIPLRKCVLNSSLRTMRRSTKPNLRDYAYASRMGADYVLREIHAGSCSMHSGPRSVVARALRSGYYWPTMHRDARDMIKKCNDCQVHRPIPRQTTNRQANHPSPRLGIPQWGIDIAGPFLLLREGFEIPYRGYRLLY
ncbi:reverse transcriptase domain-containing protein [Tanacetum coccineum]